MKDGKTGRVMPLDTSEADYVEAIEAMFRDRDIYLAYCEAALRRAQGVLNWDRWGEGIAALLREVSVSREVESGDKQRKGAA